MTIVTIDQLLSVYRDGQHDRILSTLPWRIRPSTALDATLPSLRFRLVAADSMLDLKFLAFINDRWSSLTCQAESS
jgi:hypothetical protein